VSRNASQQEFLGHKLILKIFSYYIDTGISLTLVRAVLPSGPRFSLTPKRTLLCPKNMPKTLV